MLIYGFVACLYIILSICLVKFTLFSVNTQGHQMFREILLAFMGNMGLHFCGRCRILADFVILGFLSFLYGIEGGCF